MTGTTAVTDPADRPTIRFQDKGPLGQGDFQGETRVEVVRGN